MPKRGVLTAGVALAVLLAGCGEERSADIAAPAEGPVLVPAGQVAAVQRDRAVVVVDERGQAQRLGTLPADAGEPDAVAVGQDGRLVLVSAVRLDDDDSSVCTATVFQVEGDGNLRRLAEGASAVLSPDGRLAYFRHATVDGYCRRTELVVRDLSSGRESVVVRLSDAPVGATPPSWPVNWSPDGSSIAHVTSDGVAVTTVDTGTSRAIDGLAPVWLPDGRLVVLDGCCIGPASLRAADDGSEVLVLDRPIRSVRPDRGGQGVWMALEDRGLVRWDGSALRDVLADVLVASG